MTDQEALSQYAQDHSPDAFRELIDRYAALVYAAARRQVRDPHQADDVTQAVFIVLARKVHSLHRQVVLAGWLLRTTHWICRQVQRSEHRRHIHERRAAAMRPREDDVSAPGSSEPWLPFLDQAMAQLPQGDLQVLSLRYFQNRSAHDISVLLGLSHQAAQKRVERALQRLRTYLLDSGAAGFTASFTAESLGAGLTAHGLLPVPDALSSALVQIAAGATPANASLLAHAAIKTFTWIHIKLAAAVLCGTVVLAFSAWLVELALHPATPLPPTTLALSAPSTSPATTASTTAAGIRQKFAPVPGGAIDAFWSKLEPFTGMPGAAMLQAHATLGGAFPVQDARNTTLFNVTVIDGDDDLLIVDVRTNPVQRLNLQRDKPVTITVAGRSYQFLYPSITVNDTAPPTTDKAMILVIALPQ